MTLTDNAHQLFQKASSIFVDVVGQLCSGKIKISTLGILLENETSLVQLFQIVDKFTDSCKHVPRPVGGDVERADVVKRLLEWRNEEKESFLACRKRLQYFLECCHEVKSGKRFVYLQIFGYSFISCYHRAHRF